MNNFKQCNVKGNLKVTLCGGLKNGQHRFVCVNAWPTGSGTTRSYDLVEVGVALLEEMGFEVL